MIQPRVLLNATEDPSGVGCQPRLKRPISLLWVLLIGPHFLQINDLWDNLSLLDHAGPGLGPSEFPGLNGLRRIG